MRTTIDLDKPLLGRARREAERRGQTLSGLVREAVGAYLSASPAAEDEPFEVVTCGEPGGYAPTPAEIAAVLEEEDAPPAAPVRRGRGRRSPA